MKYPPERLQCISAVTLLTSEMAKSVSFYQSLGFHLLRGGHDAPFTTFQVGDGYLNIQLHAVGLPPGSLWGRVVFWVDDVDEMYQTVLEAGFVAESSPADAPWGERYFHIHDPDGHELSFARPLAPRS